MTQSEVLDGGPSDSGAGLVDSGLVDSDLVDSGSRQDAGTTMDAGTIMDAGIVVDAGINTDAGTMEDGGNAPDAGASHDSGTDAQLLCGNGTVDTGENCDLQIPQGTEGACPTACDASDACFPNQLIGNDCNVECITEPVTTCLSDDGCCAPGCNALSDNDCPAICGNTVKEPGELCDTGIPQGTHGACPTACDTSDACFPEQLTGSACSAKCEVAPVITCVSNDGCCAPGCNALSDNDCPAVCGNTVKEPGELCDTGIPQGTHGACPTACDTSDACFPEQLTGSACSAKCEVAPVITCVSNDGCCAPGCNALSDNDCDPVCGNTLKEPGELCDTGIPQGTHGACPTGCDTSNACFPEQLTGSGCNAECVLAPVTACVSDDGCCASGCNALSDNDCSAICGNTLKEPGEICDTGIPQGTDGACPTACDTSDACFPERLSGSGCDAKCVLAPVTACVHDDGCCAPGCNALSDNDCDPVCGNTLKEPGEICDTGIPQGADGACPSACDTSDACFPERLSGSGCDAKCVLAPVTACVHDDGCCAPGCNALSDNDCSAVCGNTVKEPGEICDTGIPQGTDGACPTGCDTSDACFPEQLTGDGCDAKCMMAPVTACVSNDGCCAPGCNALSDNDCSAVCGNTVKEPGELCDTGIPQGTDGACPTACDTSDACFPTQLSGTSCNARCETTPVTTCLDDDYCCGPGCTPISDNDCAPRYSIGGTVSGLSSGVLKLTDGNETLSIQQNGTFTFATTLRLRHRYDVTIVGQPAGDVCELENGSGTVEGDVTTIQVRCHPVVHPVYSQWMWNHYVANDGPTPHSAHGRVCFDDVEGGYRSCVHAGVLRQMYVVGRASCDGLHAEDHLGAFDWICDQSTTPVRFVSVRLRPDHKLSDLLDFDAVAWRSNALAVYDESSPVAISRETTWWSDPVEEVPPSETATVPTNTVMLVLEDRETGISVTRSGSSLVVRPGVAVRANRSWPLFVGGRFNWIEGTFEAEEGNRGWVYDPEEAIRLSAARFVVLRGVTVQSGRKTGIFIGGWFGQDSRNNLIQDARILPGPGNASGLHVEHCKASTFRAIAIEGTPRWGEQSIGGVVEKENCEGNHFEDLDVRYTASQGVLLGGDRTSAWNVFSASNKAEGIVLGGSGQVLVGGQARDNGEAGILLGSDNAVVAASFSTGSGAFSHVHPPLDRPAELRLTGTHSVVLNWASPGWRGIDIPGVRSGRWQLGMHTVVDNAVNGNHYHVRALGDGNTFTGLFIGTLYMDRNTLRCEVSGWATGLGDSCEPSQMSDHEIVLALRDNRWFDFDLTRHRYSLAADSWLRDTLPLPTGDDVVEHTWADGTTTTFLRHAVELLEDDEGNDNGLCESHESCLYTPHLGHDQGTGPLIPVSPFVDGDLTGITLWRYRDGGT